MKLFISPCACSLYSPALLQAHDDQDTADTGSRGRAASHSPDVTDVITFSLCPSVEDFFGWFFTALEHQGLFFTVII